jgi:hypothetical protein
LAHGISAGDPAARARSWRKRGSHMKYLVLVRFEKNGKWSQLLREFSDYDQAFYYANDEYSREADNISVCVYELKDYFN